MDWRELIQSSDIGMQLPHLHHLPHLLIANEDLVNLQNRLLENEVNRVLQDLLRV